MDGYGSRIVVVDMDEQGIAHGVVHGEIEFLLVDRIQRLELARRLLCTTAAAAARVTRNNGASARFLPPSSNLTYGSLKPLESAARRLLHSTHASVKQMTTGRARFAPAGMQHDQQSAFER